MLDNLILVATQVGILFALMAAGACSRWFKLIDEASVKGMVNILVLIVTPCLIMDVFQRPFEPALLNQLLFAALIVVALHVIMIAVANWIVPGKSARRTSVLKLSMVLSNAGFMGIPLEQAVFGDEGVFFGVIYVAVFNLVIWSWGYRTMRGPGRPGDANSGTNWRVTLINPGTLGLALGIPLFLSSYTLPTVLHDPVAMLADLNTPLAMLIIGYYLAGMHVKAVLRDPGAYLAAFVRLVATPLALIGFFWLIRAWVNPIMALAMITAASAPSAAMTTMFAAQYHRDVDLSVGLASGTTLLSIVTMPLLIALAMSVMGL